MGESIEKKTISVSLVMYCNNIEELSVAIKCTLQSDLVDKIYLIDNSPTNELSILQNIDSLRLVYLFQNCNLGFGRAHNIAINLALKEDYKYHLILNPDIEYNGNILNSLVAYMESNLNCGMVVPKIFYKNGDLQYLCKKLPTPFELFGKRLPIKFLRKELNRRLELHHFDYNSTMNIPYLSGCFMFCRTAVFTKVGLFDDRYFMYMEDLDLSRRFHKEFETIFYPKVSIMHGFRGESRVNRKLLIALIVSAFKYYSKFGWIFDKERQLMNEALLKRINQL